MLAVLVTASPVERLHLKIYGADTGRKALKANQLAERESREGSARRQLPEANAAAARRAIQTVDEIVASLHPSQPASSADPPAHPTAAPSCNFLGELAEMEVQHEGRDESEAQAAQQAVSTSPRLTLKLQLV